MNKLISFDVFDTLITRKVTSPKVIFELMQNILMEDQFYSDIPIFVRQNFYTIRTNIEAFVAENLRINNGKMEISFDDIYNYIEINYSLSNEQKEKLKALEFTTEKNNVVPIKENIEKLEEYYKKGNDVILISDMYLSSAQIRELLLPHIKFINTIKIYVSNEYNSTKKSGKIYKIIKNDFPDTKNWLHIGDNLIADVIQTKLNGIKAKKITPTRILPFEKYLISHLNNYKINITIGHSMSLRCSNKNDKYILGASFAAPILYDYIKWVITQCLNLGINNIYFIARDGFILKKIADTIIRISQFPLKTHYFCSSRKAGRVITEETYYDYLDCIFRESYTNKSIDNILASINLNRKDIIKFLKKNNFSIETLKQELYNNTLLKKYIINKNRDKSDLFKLYIDQEISKTETKVAFVDSNGSGRTQDFIAKILYNKNKCISYNFYFHTILSVVQKEYSIKCSYIFSPRHLSSFIELLCRANDSQTIGYSKNENNRIIPLKESNKNNYIEKWGFTDYVQGILDYTKSIRDFEIQNKLDLTCLERYPILLNYVREHLDKKTADSIGSIPFSMGSYKNEFEHKEIAPKVNLFNLFTTSPFDYISIARSNYFEKYTVKLIKKIINPTTYGYISKDNKLAYLKVGKFKINIEKFIWKKSTNKEDNIYAKLR